MNQTIMVTTKALATESRLYVPASLRNAGDDHILVYDKTGDLVAWGPASDRENVMRIAKVFA